MSKRVKSHAKKRMQQRGISQQVVDFAVAFGREVYRRGATIFTVGKREAAIARAQGIKGATGVHVITEAGVVVTAYRNNDFGRAFRHAPHKRKGKGRGSRYSLGHRR